MWELMLWQNLKPPLQGLRTSFLYFNFITSTLISSSSSRSVTNRNRLDGLLIYWSKKKENKKIIAIISLYGGSKWLRTIISNRKIHYQTSGDVFLSLIGKFQNLTCFWCFQVPKWTMVTYQNRIEKSSFITENPSMTIALPFNLL